MGFLFGWCAGHFKADFRSKNNLRFCKLKILSYNIGEIKYSETFRQEKFCRNNFIHKIFPRKLFNTKKRDGDRNETEYFPNYSFNQVMIHSTWISRNVLWEPVILALQQENKFDLSKRKKMEMISFVGRYAFYCW